MRRYAETANGSTRNLIRNAKSILSKLPTSATATVMDSSQMRKTMENKELPKIKGYCKDCVFKGEHDATICDRLTYTCFGVSDCDYCSHFEPKEKLK